MSRDIRRRSQLTGLASSDLIQEYLENLTALEQLAVTDSMTGTLIYIESEKSIYAYDSEATDSPTTTSIIQPMAAINKGRWFRISSASSSSPSNAADRWVDPTHATVSEDIVVHDEWECRRGRLTIDASLTVDSGGYVYVTDGIEDTKRNEFFQTNVVPSNSYKAIPERDHLLVHAPSDKPFIIESSAHLNVHGDLVVVDFHHELQPPPASQQPQQPQTPQTPSLPSGVLGQILYIPTGTNFIPCTPVVNQSNGFILTNNFGHIIVV